jgi:hypothetical protein
MAARNVISSIPQAAPVMLQKSSQGELGSNSIINFVNAGITSIHFRILGDLLASCSWMPQIVIGLHVSSLPSFTHSPSLKSLFLIFPQAYLGLDVLL